MKLRTVVAALVVRNIEQGHRLRKHRVEVMGSPLVGFRLARVTLYLTEGNSSSNLVGAA